MKVVNLSKEAHILDKLYVYEKVGEVYEKRGVFTKIGKASI